MNAPAVICRLGALGAGWFLFAVVMLRVGAEWVLQGGVWLPAVTAGRAARVERILYFLRHMETNVQLLRHICIHRWAGGGRRVNKSAVFARHRETAWKDTSATSTVISQWHLTELQRRVSSNSGSTVHFSPNKTFPLTPTASTGLFNAANSPHQRLDAFTVAITHPIPSHTIMSGTLPNQLPRLIGGWWTISSKKHLKPEVCQKQLTMSIRLLVSCCFYMLKTSLLLWNDGLTGT